MKLFLLLCAVAVVLAADDDYCLGKDRYRLQTRQFSSKTAYEIIRGTHLDKQYLVPGCEPNKMWIFHRHGTRLPSASTIESAPRLEELRDLIVKNYRVDKTKPDTDALCDLDLLALQMWKWNSSISSDQAEYLTSQGYTDLRGTANDYQKYYRSILPKDYNNSYYMFRHTDTQRTRESFKAFTSALFGENNAAKAEDIPEKDLLLRPYDYCESYKEQNYKGAGSESAKFRASTLWNRTLSDISRRLGFMYTLAGEDIQLMYDICRFEQAWQVERTSTWCVAFLPEHVTVLEYDEDLKYYYKAGYGFAENARLNCRVVKDMLEHLSSTSTPNVIANFGHSTGVQTLVTALGINKDDIPLTATNYDSLTNRRWKTSNMDPFAANFVAVKYQCPAEALNKEKVVFFLNEDAVQLDWCRVGLCNWSEVLKRLESFANADCNEYYCRSGAPLGVAMSSLLSLLLAAAVYLIH